MVADVSVVGMIVLLLALVVTIVVLVVVVSNDDSHGGFGGGPLCLKCRHSVGTFALENDAGWYIQLSQHCLSVTQPYPLGAQITQGGWARKLHSSSSPDLCGLSRPAVKNGSTRKHLVRGQGKIIYPPSMKRCL